MEQQRQQQQSNMGGRMQDGGITTLTPSPTSPPTPSSSPMRQSSPLAPLSRDARLTAEFFSRRPTATAAAASASRLPRRPMIPSYATHAEANAPSHQTDATPMQQREQTRRMEADEKTASNADNDTDTDRSRLPEPVPQNEPAEQMSDEYQYYQPDDGEFLDSITLPTRQRVPLSLWPSDAEEDEEEEEEVDDEDEDEDENEHDIPHATNLWRSGNNSDVSSSDDDNGRHIGPFQRARRGDDESDDDEHEMTSQSRLRPRPPSPHPAAWIRDAMRSNMSDEESNGPGDNEHDNDELSHRQLEAIVQHLMDTAARNREENEDSTSASESESEEEPDSSLGQSTRAPAEREAARLVRELRRAVLASRARHALLEDGRGASEPEDDVDMANESDRRLRRNLMSILLGDDTEAVVAAAAAAASSPSHTQAAEAEPVPPAGITYHERTFWHQDEWIPLTELESVQFRSPPPESKMRVTKEEVQKGRDMQGIPWHQIHVTRAQYRVDRDREYSNITGLPPIPNELKSQLTPTNDTPNFYTFHSSTQSILPAYFHPQLRHLTHATSCNDVFSIGNQSVQHVNLATCLGEGDSVMGVDVEVEREKSWAEDPDLHDAAFPLPRATTLHEFPGGHYPASMSVHPPFLITGCQQGELRVMNYQSGMCVADINKVATGPDVDNCINNAIVTFRNPMQDEILPDGSLLPQTGTDGIRVLVSNNDKFARLYDMETLKMLRDYNESWCVNYAMPSPDGTRVCLVGDSNDVLLRDAQSGKLIDTLTGHRNDMSVEHGRHVGQVGALPWPSRLE